jgi:STE24 endopeptidase
MFLMEASAKTNEINAYVTGVGASKRVVVWDTTVQKTNPDEVLAVVGHELGHYVLGHTWKGFLFFTGGMLVGLYVAYRALQWVLARWGKAWGVRGQEDWAALAVLLLIFHVLEFVGTPIGNGFSRMQEHAADVYGLEVTHGILPHSQEVAAQSFQKMGDIDLADPNPSKFITFWLYSTSAGDACASRRKRTAGKMDWRNGGWALRSLRQEGPRQNARWRQAATPGLLLAR